MRSRFAIALSLVLALLAIGLPAAAQEPTDQPAPPPRPTRAYFVALGEFAGPTIDELAAYHRNRYGVSVEVLPPLNVTGGQLHLLRRQVIAEELVTLMRDSYSEIANAPDAVVLGITELDMYARGIEAPFVYEWRQDGRFGVVSTLHTGSNDFRRPASREQVHLRVQKMVTRNLGVLMFGLPLNGDPDSILFGSLATLEDLDRMGADLPL